MKILAIRGKDLASLAGEFALELTAPPLAGAGLFAITGPTGAGKSTLLDALCLALFDRTPRLSGRGGAAVGRGPEKERLRASDRRSLLRTGAASASAEVEFLGADGKRYRASWSVRRARSRSDGKLQNQELILTELERGTRIGEGKEGTLAEIERRLGLSYDQFRRSVLLAQGDFAAFLTAEAAERAALLERMTGTGLYRELSIAAHARAALERAALERLVEDAGRLAPLPEDQRTAREAELATARAELAAAVSRKEEAAAVVAGFREAARLEREEGAAAQLLAGAEAQLAAAAPRRIELEALEQAAALRSVVEAADAAVARDKRAADAASARGREAVVALEKAAVAEAAAVVASAACGVAVAAREAASPELERARALDIELAGAAREAKDAAARAAEAAAASGKVAAEQAARAAALAASKLAEEEAEAALVAGVALAPLELQWERWRALLGREVERAGRLTEARSQGEKLMAAAGASSRTAALAAEQARTAGVALEAARAALVLADGAGAEGLVVAARSRREAADARTASLNGLCELVLEHGAATEQATHAGVQQAKARDDAAASALARVEEAAREQQAAALAEEAARALELARRQADLAAHRPALREGEPCPLCGATAHPHARDGAPLSSVLTGQEARVRELQKQASAHHGLAAAAGAREEQQKQQAAHAAAALSGHQAVLLRLEARYAAMLSTLRGLPGASAPGPAFVAAHPAAPGAPASLAAAATAAAGELSAARAEEQAAGARLAAVHTARAAAESARTAADAADAERRRTEEEAARAARALADHQAALARELTAATAATDELSEGLSGVPNFRGALLADPARLLSWCEGLVAERRAHARRRDEARAGRELLQAAAVQGAAVAAAALATAGAARTEAAARAERRAAVATARSALLGGRSAAEVDEALAATHAAAAKRAELAIQARDSALLAAAAAKAQQAEAESATGAAVAESASSRAALVQALAAAGLEEPVVRARLAREPGWIAGERAALAVLAEARASAEAVKAGWSRQRAELAASGPPPFGEGEAVARATEAAAAAGKLGELAGSLGFQLQQDDLLLKQQLALGPELAAARERDELWGSLGTLIGHHQGLTFQRFAQSLTLDGLVASANDHLAELSRRYRLERVPGEDLELQVVDTQLGEEVRSVQSLSGGESFLVSLALALGLSSMVSGQTRVDSLFIDEGFGSLDPATLETVLSALDALQSTGRQVGLISHVPGLAERIGVQVQVRPVGGGQSRVEVFAA